MSGDKFKIIREDEKVGVWFDKICYLKTMKHVKNRNKGLYEYLKKKLEDLTEKKFNDEDLKYI